MKISVTVKPRAREEKVEKTDNGYLVYVREPAEENKANRALREVLSKYFGVSKSKISILSGLKSRHKIVEIK